MPLKYSVKTENPHSPWNGRFTFEQLEGKLFEGGTDHAARIKALQHGQYIEWYLDMYYKVKRIK